MSYQISFTDSVNKGFIQVDDNTVNNETSLKLPGRTKSDYGELVLENLLHLMENFANNNPPTNPVEGQLWYDTTVGVDQLKVYDGAQFVSASSIKKANSRPETGESNLGDLWVDTVNQQLFLYNGNDWTLIGPDFSLGSNTGAKFEIIIDTTNVERSVIVNYVEGEPLLIISDVEFRPKLSISQNGFPQGTIIKQGINIAAGTKYYGTSEKAEALIVGNVAIPAANFARRDTDNTFVKSLRIQNNGGISIGETPTLQIAIAGSANSIFRNLASGGDLQFRLTESTGSNTVLTLKSNKQVGINTANPTEALEVVGNVKASGNLLINGSAEVNGAVLLTDNLIVTGAVSTGNITTKNLLPDEPGRNIGTATDRFNNIFSQTVSATTFTGSTFTGTFNGTLNGAATSLTANSVFSLAGDVVSTNQIIYGGAGNVGGSKIFTTEISSDFITTKTATSEVAVDDELLIVRNNQLLKVTQETLVSTIPLIPIGTILQYGGDIAPPGWLMCDGSILSVAIYNSLHSVIRWKYNPSLTNSLNFKLPDYRGRVPLGNTTMGINPTPAELTEVVDSGPLGSTGGSPTVTISDENLPDHFHSLEGDSNTQFYAVTNISDTPDSDSVNLNTGGTLPSSGITRTGSVIGTTGQPFVAIDPYQTTNYIIYAGVIA